MSEPVRDYGAEAQAAAEKHLSAVWDHFHSEEKYVDPDVPSPAVGPFCGCQTCEVREVLSVAWDLIQEGVARGDLTLADVVAAGTHDTTTEENR